MNNVLKVHEDYLIQYQENKGLLLEEFVDNLKIVPGVKLSELRLHQLTSLANGHLIEPGEGVYIFKEGLEIFYVGKVTAMSFTERIGKHIDIRNNAWFNTLLKYRHEQITNQNKDNYSEYPEQGYKSVLSDFSLVLINFERVENDSRMRDRINYLESILRYQLKPYNSISTRKGDGYLKKTLEDCLTTEIGG